MSDLAMVDYAVEAATSFLADARSPDLLWRDFRTLAGESCDWVSGFVAFTAGSAGVLRDAVRASTRVLLQRQRRGGGWSYNNELVPSDCDSTAWVLLAMSTTTVWKPSSVLRGISYVLRHTAGNGFATYTDEDRIDRFIGAEPEQTHGWRTPHVCVTAAAAQALLLHGLGPDDPRIRQAIAALREAQGEDGCWSSYWWKGPSYASALALRTLAAAGELSREVWERGSRGLLARQSDDGGFGDGDPDGEPHAFATAMALTALLTRPDPACDGAVEAAAEWLLARQDEEDGCWSSVPILRIPPPMASLPVAGEWKEDGLGTGVIVRDQHNIFTTAAALGALATYRSRTATLLRESRQS